jgi:hypothetical protein
MVAAKLKRMLEELPSIEGNGKDSNGKAGSHKSQATEQAAALRWHDNN